MRDLYAFGGRKYSGKDAGSDVLVSDYGFVKVNMSDPINEATRAANPTIIVREYRIPLFGRIARTRTYAEYLDEDCGGDFTLAKEHPPFRNALVGIGAAGRYLDPMAWTNKAREVVEAHLAAGRRVVVSGLRFPNEIEMVSSLGGSTIWVTRPGYDDTSDTSVTENSVSADDFDHVMRNDGTLADLGDRVRRIVLS